MDVIIYNINECMREIDKEDAQNSINFLSDSIKTTNSQSIKLVFSKLMESQMQTLMLASSNEDYIFKTINQIETCNLIIILKSKETKKTKLPVSKAKKVKKVSKK